MTIRVLKPGLLSSLQDTGRYGYQQYGVIAGGAMDSFAHKAANLLVGNAYDEATLEMTLLGPALLFEAPAVLAVCGADLSPQIDGTPVPMWAPFYVKAGATLQFGAPRAGCRSYLAVSGGFDVPRRLGSYSTYLRAGLGGFRGRALQEGDQLPIKPASPLGERIAERLGGCSEYAAFGSVPWRISYELIPAYTANPTIRIIPGAQYSLFEPASLEDLISAEFAVQPQSDRMGYRLAGRPLRMRERAEMLSEPVAFGTIQVPPDGNPILLMADRQTTGGYPKIAQVISADLPLLAQLQIGGRIRFSPVDLREAQETYLMTELNLNVLNKSIQLQF